MCLVGLTSAVLRASFRNMSRLPRKSVLPPCEGAEHCELLSSSLSEESSARLIITFSCIGIWNNQGHVISHQNAKCGVVSKHQCT